MHTSYPFSSLSTYTWDLFPTKLVTKVKPNINSVKVRPQLSNNRRPVHGELVRDSLLWPLDDTFVEAGNVRWLSRYQAARVN
jgi:hypothetical protein